MGEPTDSLEGAGSVELNVHLTLPPSWADAARDLSRALAGLGSAVDLGLTVPHATVYLATWPTPALPELRAALCGLAREAGPVVARLAGARVAGRGYVFLDVERTPSLERLHALALDRLSPLRRGLVAPDVLELARSLSPRESALAHEHGFPWVRELYAPHVTVARVPVVREAEAAALLRSRGPVAGAVQAFPELALGTCGRHGTVVGTLERALLPFPARATETNG